jgi:m7GpppX diphosphatase
VHCSLEAGATQAVGKAFGLENIIGQLEGMADGKGMADVALTYTIGENHDLWKEVYAPLKAAAKGTP